MNDNPGPNKNANGDDGKTNKLNWDTVMDTSSQESVDESTCQDNQITTILDLPNEMIEAILRQVKQQSYFDDSLFAAMEVCEQWNAIVNEVIGFDVWVYLKAPTDEPCSTVPGWKPLPLTCLRWIGISSCKMVFPMRHSVTCELKEQLVDFLFPHLVRDFRIFGNVPLSYFVQLVSPLINLTHMAIDISSLASWSLKSSLDVDFFRGLRLKELLIIPSLCSRLSEAENMIFYKNFVYLLHTKWPCITYFNFEIPNLRELEMALILIPTVLMFLVSHMKTLKGATLNYKNDSGPFSDYGFQLDYHEVYKGQKNLPWLQITAYLLPLLKICVDCIQTYIKFDQHGSRMKLSHVAATGISALKHVWPYFYNVLHNLTYFNYNSRLNGLLGSKCMDILNLKKIFPRSESTIKSVNLLLRSYLSTSGGPHDLAPFSSCVVLKQLHLYCDLVKLPHWLPSSTHGRNTEVINGQLLPKSLESLTVRNLWVSSRQIETWLTRFPNMTKIVFQSVGNSHGLGLSFHAKNDMKFLNPRINLIIH